MRSLFRTPLPDHPLVYVNEAYERITGYSPLKALGRNCRYLQGEESSPEVVQSMREAIDAERPVSVELINYRKNGEPFWNRVELTPLCNKAGETTHFVGFRPILPTESRLRRQPNGELRWSPNNEQLSSTCSIGWMDWWETWQGYLSRPKPRDDRACVL